MNYDENNEIRNESETEAVYSEMPMQDEEPTSDQLIPDQTPVADNADPYEEELAKQQIDEGFVVISYKKEEKKATAGKINFGRLAIIGIAICLIAAMAGAIAEAYYGIPSELEERILDYLDEDIIDYYNTYADELYG